MAGRDTPSGRDYDAVAERELFIVPKEHRTAVLEGLAQAERGEFATDEEMAALWKKCGL
jgi:predicted transcriptional regulator